MAKISSLLNKEKSSRILQELCNHDNYNVRWTALQELFNVDQDIAIKNLKKFICDQNPSISAKAKEEYIRISEIMSNKV